MEGRGRSLDSGRPQVRHAHFTASLDEARIAVKAYVGGIVHSDLHEIVDARSAARFAGEE
jgi:thiosulfate/3-mercaptopyruvate sulfurtransferase